MSIALQALALVLAAVVPALAQGSSTTTSTSLPPTVTEYETTVKGTVPELAGRWLMVAWLDIPGGEKRTAAGFWEFEGQGAQQKLVTKYVLLPPKQNAALTQLSEQGKPWEPSSQDLADVANAWDRLERMPTRPARLDSYLTGRDAFDATFTAEPKAKDAQWVVQQTETFDASAAPAVRGINIAMAIEAVDGGWRGNYISTLLASAPFPIPITLNGTFQLYRLPTGSSSAGGLAARIADLFRGCGK